MTTRRMSAKPRAPAEIQPYATGTTDEMRSTHEVSRVMSEAIQHAAETAPATMKTSMSGDMAASYAWLDSPGGRTDAGGQLTCRDGSERAQRRASRAHPAVPLVARLCAVRLGARGDRDLEPHRLRRRLHRATLQPGDPTGPGARSSRRPPLHLLDAHRPRLAALPAVVARDPHRAARCRPARDGTGARHARLRAAPGAPPGQGGHLRVAVRTAHPRARRGLPGHRRLQRSGGVGARPVGHLLVLVGGCDLSARDR